MCPLSDQPLGSTTPHSDHSFAHSYANVSLLQFIVISSLYHHIESPAIFVHSSSSHLVQLNAVAVDILHEKTSVAGPPFLAARSVLLLLLCCVSASASRPRSRSTASCHGGRRCRAGYGAFHSFVQHLETAAAADVLGHRCGHLLLGAAILLTAQGGPSKI